MQRDSPLADNRAVLVDANVFFAVGRPSNPKYVRFRREVRRSDTVLELPRRVVGELGGPETDRIETALEEGWAEIVDAPELQHGDAVAASDVARRTIAHETGQPEHAVEKADVILAGLAVQYLLDRPIDGVVVLTDDVAARNGIENAVENSGYTEAVTVCGVRDVIGDDPDGSTTLL